MSLSRGAIDLVGYMAATMTTISFLPQLIRVVKLRSAREISLGMFLIFTTGTAFWCAYGIFTHSWPVMMANAITFVLSASILFLKLRFDAEHRTDEARESSAMGMRSGR
ncbi:MAG TPA: SemiSWEET transporter [Acidobacteriaceae bacterium]|nr:SemiSWEET transporter [Acidobacteriaceae bacterium]